MIKGSRRSVAATFVGAARHVGVLIALPLAVACGHASPAPARTGTEQAAFMEQTRCVADTGADEKMLAPVLAGSAVQSVRPLYAVAESGKGGALHQLRGVVVTVSALPGLTDVWLDRALECHGARQTLGRVPPSDDPFWLPGTVVDIDVRSAKDGYDVAVTGFSPEDAREIQARAETFARARNLPLR